MLTHQFTGILAILGMFIVIFIFSGIWVSHYRKVSVNRVLIVSGRLNRMPDGSVRGFRIVKGGGTFVIPQLETADELSLEVFAIEMPKCRARTAQGAPMQADCIAQVKIKSDDASIVAAAEHFLSKNGGEMQTLIKPVLERHLAAILGNLNREEIERDPAACAARMQSAAVEDLGKMGLGLVSFTIRDVRSG